MALLEGKAIVNIKEVNITTHEATPKTYSFDTASEATYTGVVSEGQEQLLRVKNKILAIDRTEDLQYGTDLTFKDTTFIPEVFALVDGGTLEGVAPDYTGYEPPVGGEVVTRTVFDLEIVTEEKDLDGSTLGYAKFKFPNCKGKPASFNFQDGTFMAPEYTIMSRCKKGEAPYSIAFEKVTV